MAWLRFQFGPVSYQDQATRHAFATRQSDMPRNPNSVCGLRMRIRWCLPQ
jgi:hypothetical protein